MDSGRGSTAESGPAAVPLVKPHHTCGRRTDCDCEIMAQVVFRLWMAEPVEKDDDLCRQSTGGQDQIHSRLLRLQSLRPVTTINGDRL